MGYIGLEKQKLSELQSKLLDMQKWFHKFCVQNNLRYYALGGTVLGAVRHKGFIPWDDDIDIGMPRSDYDRFLELCKGKRFGKYCVESIDTTAEDYFYGYSKVYDTSTTLVELNRVNVKRGIYIDLFPLDGVGMCESDIKKVFPKIQRRYLLLVARTCALNKRRALYKNLIAIFARLIPNCIINNKKLLVEIDGLCRKESYDRCNIVGNLLGNWGVREVMPKKYLGNPTIYTFEDSVIYGPENYEAYLTSLYNDWRKLPPIDKRVSHHDCAYMNLNEPYMK